MFTKQHYKAIAEIIKGNTDTAADDDQSPDFREGLFKARKWITRDLADYFAGDNPHFNREKFLQACGLTVMVDGQVD